MQPRVSLLSAPEPCEYLPDQICRMRYEVEDALTPDRYSTRLVSGWRRFGPILFRHECPSCQRCQSLRVPVDTFRPSEGQRRVSRKNAATVTIRIGTPASSPEKLDLFRRFRLHGHRTKGWPFDPDQDLSLFTSNPFPTEEWAYAVGERLVGVGYVDALRDGLSAIYFFHDPEEGRRSLGTFNVLTMIDVARQRRLAHVYLGYYVQGCRSLEYKANYRPHERLTPAGTWEAN